MSAAPGSAGRRRLSPPRTAALPLPTHSVALAPPDAERDPLHQGLIVQRATLKPRDYQIDLAAKLNKTQVVSLAMPLNQQVRLPRAWRGASRGAEIPAGGQAGSSTGRARRSPAPCSQPHAAKSRIRHVRCRRATSAPCATASCATPSRT